MRKFLLANLQSALNRYLKMDPHSKVRLRALQGKCVTVCIKPFNMHYQLNFESDQIEVKSGDLLKSQIKISGTPLQLAALALTPKERHRFFADDVEIEGNVVLANEVIKLFDDLSIDWEEQIAQKIGDAPSHYLTQFANKMKTWGEHLDKTFTENVNEYLHEEIDLLPSKQELENFYHAVDDMRMDFDRLLMHFNQLHKAFFKGTDE